MTRSYSNLARHGLTLVELLVVLTIIAVLSTVALRSVAQITEEKRFEANTSQLEEIGRAVLGDTDTVGFVGDIGRLPIGQGAVAEELLTELWTGGDLPAYAISTPNGDSEVRLGVGWRGPYLDLGVNRSNLTDGFGQPFVYYEADGDEATDGERIAIVQSLGIDGLAGGSGVDTDTAVVLEAATGAVTNGLANVETVAAEDIAITVSNETGAIQETDGRFLIVRVYGANFAADGTGGLQTLAQARFDFDDATDNPGGVTQLASWSLTLNGVPYGPKVFRAYQLNETTEPGNEEDLTEEPASAPTADRASAAVHEVIAGRTGAITLTLFDR